MYYKTLPELMSLYQKLIFCWAQIFDKRLDVGVLDNMNFNKNIFDFPFKMDELFKHLPIEPGYYSPDASSELDALARLFESRRLTSLFPHASQKMKKIINNSGVGFGNGTSNVVFNILRSLVALKERSHPEYKQNVVVALPNYPVYYSQLLSLNIETRLVMCSQRNNFLPTADEILSMCDENTTAVLLTYPNNPSQFTYTQNETSPIHDIIKFCQNRGINLIIDNIYRDMTWDESKSYEVFSDVDSSDNLFVVYGPSKDTAFMSGYRLGYWIGDNKISEKYRELVSASENCLNSVSIAIFALYLLFLGSKHANNKSLNINDIALLQNGCLGWSVKISTQELQDIINGCNWYEYFCISREGALEKQAMATSQITEYLSSTKVLSPAINGNIGNLILTGVSDSYYNKSSFSLYENCLEKIGVGILPGEVFGLHKLDNGSIPFRITTIHDHPEAIIKNLEKIEKYFSRKH